MTIHFFAVSLQRLINKNATTMKSYIKRAVKHFGIDKEDVDAFLFVTIGTIGTLVLSLAGFAAMIEIAFRIGIK